MPKQLNQKNPKKQFLQFGPWFQKKNRLKKSWVHNGTELAGEFEKLCEAEGLQMDYTMSDTRAAFAERRKRCLTNTLYRYIDDYGYRYIHKLSQVVETLYIGKPIAR